MMQAHIGVTNLWNMGSCCIASRFFSGTLGKMTSCSTVIRMVPSPYLQ